MNKSDETRTQTNETKGTNNNSTEVNTMNKNSDTNDKIDAMSNNADEEMLDYVIANGKKYRYIDDAMRDIEKSDVDTVNIDVYYKGELCDSQIAERNPYSGNFVFTCYSIVRYTYCDYDSSEYKWAFIDDEDCIYLVFHRDGIIVDYDSEVEAYDFLFSLKDEEGVAHALEPNLETYGEYLGEDSASTIFTPDGYEFNYDPKDADTTEDGDIVFKIRKHD